MDWLVWIGFGWLVGLVGGQAWMDGQVDRHGWAGGQMDGRINDWMDKQIDS